MPNLPRITVTHAPHDDYPDYDYLVRDRETGVERRLPESAVSEYVEGWRNCLAFDEAVDDLEKLAQASLDTWVDERTPEPKWWGADSLAMGDYNNPLSDEHQDAAFIAAVSPRVILGMLATLNFLGYETPRERKEREERDMATLIAAFELPVSE